MNFDDLKLLAFVEKAMRCYPSNNWKFDKKDSPYFIYSVYGMTEEERIAIAELYSFYPIALEHPSVVEFSSEDKTTFFVHNLNMRQMLKSILIEK